MVFWIIAALLTLVASLAIIWPLSRARAMPAASAHDLEVYRDQLDEVERDKRRGLIGDAEAEQARTEIGRRILKLGGDRASAASGETGIVARAVGVCAVLAVPLVSWTLYGFLGSPDLPGQPLHARLEKNPAENSVVELVARAEAHLASNPKDGRGWDVLGPIYQRLGRFDDAVTAYRNAIDLMGGSAQRWAGLGETLANAGNGIVSADAQAAFQRALEFEAGNPKASFYLAVASMQEGRVDEAVAGWSALATRLPADSPWRSVAQQALEQALAASTSEAASAGPDPAAIDAAAGMAPADRTAMIEGMVAALDEKLRTNPSDADGWRKLIRSYVVLGREVQAREAVARAVSAFGSGSGEADGIIAFAASLGVKATE